jgi:tetratricopeptide (TPR) repeat protein
MRIRVALVAFVVLTGSALAARALEPALARAALVEKIAELRAANYALDETAAARLAGELRRWADDPAFPHRAVAAYQAGTANGLLASFVSPGSLAHPQGDAARRLAYLDEATACFELAVALDPTFADAHAAIANNTGIRGAGEADPERRRALTARSRAARERSLALAPRNPRVVLGDAGRLFWAPAEAGGDRARGLERYQEALALFAVEPAAERGMHAWGEPDALAFVAFARLALTPPDVRAARQALERALSLQPGFTWARRALLPRLEAAEAKAP